MTRRSLKKWGLIGAGCLVDNLTQRAEGILMHKWISYDCGDQQCCYDEPNCNNDLKRGEDAIRCITNLAADCSVEIWSYAELGLDDMCERDDRHIRVDATPLIGSEIISMRGSIRNHNENPKLQKDFNIIWPETYWNDDVTALWRFQQPPWDAPTEEWCDFIKSSDYNFEEAFIVHGGNRSQQIFTWLDFRIPKNSNLTQINSDNSFWTFSITARSVLDAAMMEAYNNTESWDRWPLTDHPELEVDAPPEFSLTIKATTTTPFPTDASESSPTDATDESTGTSETETETTSFDHNMRFNNQRRQLQESTNEEKYPTTTSTEGTPRPFVFPTYPENWVEPHTLVKGFPETQFQWQHAKMDDPRIGLFIKQSFSGLYTAAQKAESDARRKLHVTRNNETIARQGGKLVYVALMGAGLLTFFAVVQVFPSDPKGGEERWGKIQEKKRRPKFQAKN